MWFERNVVYSVCIRFECSGCHGWVSKKNKNVDRGVGGWVELYPILFGIF